MTLGDHFPKKGKKDFIKQNLVEGNVIYLHVNHTIPPKEKYLLIGHVDDCIRVFTINSEIHPFIKSKEHLLSGQILLNKSDHEFLDHDSYINCTEIVDIPVEDVEGQVIDDMSRIKGSISDGTREKVLSAVNESLTLTQLDIILITQALPKK
ncbi:MAG: hypothetical protein QM484_14385 [Woeseiaceae bacterium]